MVSSDSGALRGPSHGVVLVICGMSESENETELAPVPQTRAAFDWLAHYGNHEVEESVTQMAQRVREIAPGCVALSLTLAHGDLTFTVMTDRRRSTSSRQSRPRTRPPTKGAGRCSLPPRR
jgi:hypothetical protein